MRVFLDTNVIRPYCENRPSFISMLNEIIDGNQIEITWTPILVVEYLGIVIKDIVKDVDKDLRNFLKEHKGKIEKLLPDFYFHIYTLVQQHPLISNKFIEERLAYLDKQSLTFKNLNVQLRNSRLFQDSKKEFIQSFAHSISIPYIVSYSFPKNFDKKNIAKLFVTYLVQSFNFGLIESYSKFSTHLLQNISSYDRSLKKEKKEKFEKIEEIIAKGDASFKSFSDFGDGELIDLALRGYCTKRDPVEYEKCRIITCDNPDQLLPRLYAYIGLISRLRDYITVSLQPGEILFLTEEGQYKTSTTVEL